MTAHVRIEPAQIVEAFDQTFVIGFQAFRLVESRLEILFRTAVVVHFEGLLGGLAVLLAGLDVARVEAGSDALFLGDGSVRGGGLDARPE